VAQDDSNKAVANRIERIGMACGFSGMLGGDLCGPRCFIGSILNRFRSTMEPNFCAPRQNKSADRKIVVAFIA
jgi:hypothetical protein